MGAGNRIGPFYHYYECSTSGEFVKADLGFEGFGDAMERIRGVVAIRIEKTGEEVIKTVTGVGVFVLDGRIKIGVGGKFAFDNFFVGQTFENSHNGGIGIFTFKLGEDVGGLEGL